MYATECTTSTTMSSCIMRGAHLRMGVESLNELMKLLEEDWEAGEECEREPLEEVACFVLAS